MSGNDGKHQFKKQPKLTWLFYLVCWKPATSWGVGPYYLLKSDPSKIWFSSKAEELLKLFFASNLQWKNENSGRLDTFCLVSKAMWCNSVLSVFFMMTNWHSKCRKGPPSYTWMWWSMDDITLNFLLLAAWHLRHHLLPQVPWSKLLA